MISLYIGIEISHHRALVHSYCMPVKMKFKSYTDFRVGWCCVWMTFMIRLLSVFYVSNSENNCVHTRIIEMMEEVIFFKNKLLALLMSFREEWLGVLALESDTLRLISSPSLLSVWTNSSTTSGDDNTYLWGMLWRFYRFRYEISLENSLAGYDGLCL